MRKWTWLFSLLLLLFSPLTFAADKAVLLHINGAIGPATQDYIQRGIEKAVADKAAVVIIQLNTPGGLDTSMRGINQAIITSAVPIIAYVAPSGARAASAGTYIMYASHLNAMASGTNLGAATPIHLFAPTGDTKNSKEIRAEDKKALNDAAAYLRGLAQLRDRNVNWADTAVRSAASISATEALKLKVIDVIANNYDELLAKLDGRKTQVQAIQQTVHTKNLQIVDIKPDWRYEFLSFLTDPNIAYILMLIAMYGLFFELSNPGAVFPGVAGIIALILCLYAFQLMPINYVGLTLLLLGVAFMLFEVYVMSFGVIGIGGLIAFVIGSLMLFDMHNPDYRIAMPLIFAMSTVSVIFFFILLSMAVKSHKRAIVSGKEHLIGRDGVVLSVMNEQVIVRVLGEIWDARAPVMLDEGQQIRVVGIHGLTLMVEPIEKPTKKLGE